MAKNNTQHIESRQLKRLLHLLFAVAVYTAAAIFLFHPIQSYLNFPKLLIPLASILAAMGCHILGRRWIPAVDASLLSGFLYGFGPYLLSFKTAHPLAAVGIALLPWLFCPAALWHKYETPTVARVLIRILLMAAPFAVLFAWFWLPTLPIIGPYFLMPQGPRLELADLFALTGVIDPGSSRIIPGFCSAALILSLLGTIIFLQTARVGVFVPVLVGVVLAFWDPLGPVSPLVWFALPGLYLAVTAGIAAGSLPLFGSTDRKWIVICLIAAIIFAAITFDSDFPIPTYFFLLTAVSMSFFLLFSKFPFRTLQIKKILIAALILFNLYIITRPILS